MNPPANLSSPIHDKFAGAYAFDDRIVIVTYGRARDGSIHQAPVCFTVKLPATDDSLGYGVMHALESYASNYIPPLDPDVRRKTHLKALGVRTERELQRYAKFCLMHRTQDSIAFQPMHNGGHKGEQKGFRPIAETAFALAGDAVNFGTVGAALRRAFLAGTSAFE